MVVFLHLLSTSFFFKKASTPYSSLKGIVLVLELSILYRVVLNMARVFWIREGFIENYLVAF